MGDLIVGLGEALARFRAMIGLIVGGGIGLGLAAQRRVLIVAMAV